MFFDDLPPIFPQTAEDKRSKKVGTEQWIFENRKVPDLTYFFGFQQTGGPAWWWWHLNIGKSTWVGDVHPHLGKILILTSVFLNIFPNYDMFYNAWSHCFELLALLIKLFEPFPQMAKTCKNCDLTQLAGLASSGAGLRVFSGWWAAKRSNCAPARGDRWQGDGRAVLNISSKGGIRRIYIYIYNIYNIYIYILCVCMLAVVVAVLIAYDYDCARTL